MAQKQVAVTCVLRRSETMCLAEAREPVPCRGIRDESLLYSRIMRVSQTLMAISILQMSIRIYSTSDHLLSRGKHSVRPGTKRRTTMRLKLNVHSLARNLLESYPKLIRAKRSNGQRRVCPNMIKTRHPTSEPLPKRGMKNARLQIEPLSQPERSGLPAVLDTTPFKPTKISIIAP
ncbi:hypothetical protein BB8028_0007g01510 [Beauveria bassiana]|uniref:Uncharacterized protein n=1 Tax=Beauveria bassiana TaxID=176275 RepID=A0A2S7YL87_BEABA|nr:hypothetical protein BB8028_0007g01510 [Beauveria bassiana]